MITTGQQGATGPSTVLLYVLSDERSKAKIARYRKSPSNKRRVSLQQSWELFPKRLLVEPDARKKSVPSSSRYQKSLKGVSSVWGFLRYGLSDLPQEPTDRRPIDRLSYDLSILRKRKFQITAPQESFRKTLA
jgi:hypothetical protein